MQMELADAATGKWLSRFNSQTVGCWPFKFMSDGCKLYVTGWHGPNEIWDANSGEPIGTWSRGESPFEIALSPDSKTVASAERRSVRLVTADTGRLQFQKTACQGRWTIFDFIPDGQRLFGASHRSGDGFTIWDRTTGRRLLDYPMEYPAASLLLTEITL